jgi:hypothetical protein
MRSTPNSNQFQHKDNPLEEDMNDETLKFIKIIISKGSSVPGGVTRSRYQVACGERNIQQRGVFGNGEVVNLEIGKMV